VSEKGSFDPALEPYVIQSGKHAGESPTIWAFRNPRRFKRILRRREDEYRKAIRAGRDARKDRLHIALEWLNTRKPQTKVRCPFCNQGPVRFFAVLEENGIVQAEGRFTSCEALSCKMKMEEAARATGKYRMTLEVQLKSILPAYKGQADCRKLTSFMLVLMGITGRLDRDELHQAMGTSPGLMQEDRPTLPAEMLGQGSLFS